MSNSTDRQWERVLNPQALRSNLIGASLYMTGFELLKDSIIDRIRSFLSDWTGEEFVPSEDYSKEVLSQGKSVLYASLGWLTDNNVIDQLDLDSFENIKRLRNELAHELPSFLLEGNYTHFVEMFGELHRLVDKIEKWWLINVEIPTNPDFDENEIDEGGIVAGPVWMLQLLREVALGEEPDAHRYFEHFKARHETA